MSGFGGTIKLTGEEAYRKALQGIAADLKNVIAQQKLTAASYDRTDTSMTAMSKRAEDLKNRLDVQNQKVKTLTNALKDYQAQQEKHKATLQSYQSQLDKERAKLAEIEKQYGKNSKEYETQAKVVDDLEKQVKELNDQYDKNELTIKKTEAALTGAEAAVKKTSNQIEKLADQTENAGDESEKLGKAVGDAGNKATEAGNGGFTVLKGVLANLATQVINRVTSGMKQLASSVVQAGIDFDKGMSRVEAISGATSSEMEQLTQKAIEMGRTTKFSAAEASSALYYMAMAGWKASDMLEGLQPVLDLAAASGEDLARTSDIVTDALTAMGYGAEDAGHLADVMAAAAANANTTVDMMGSTFKYVGAVAGSLGYSMEDVAVSISLMANSGIKAEMAGTALRSLMMRLSTDTGGAAKAARKLGVEITNADGSMRKWDTVVTELRSAFQGLSQAEQSQYAKTIAGTRAMNGFLAIMNSTEADVKQVTTAINKSSGAAKQMADTMLNNVGGQFTKLQRQLQTEFLKIWERIAPTVQKAIQSISKELKKLDWKAFGDMAEQAIGVIKNAFIWILQNKDAVMNSIAGVFAALAVVKVVDFGKQVVKTIGSISTAFSALKALIVANPLLVALGAIAAGFVAINAAIAQNNREPVVKLNEEMQNLKDTIDDQVESWDALSEAKSDIIESTNKEMDGYQSLVDELNNIVDADGRVRKGYEQRAQFIASTLAEAFGIEIKMQNGVIQGYDKMMESLDDLIKKKRAEAILEGQEAQYKEAIQNRTAAIEQMNKAYTAWQAKEKEISDLREQFKEALNSESEAVKKAAQDAIDSKQREVTAMQNEYNKAQGLVYDYAETITLYENNMAEMTAKNYDKVKATLDSVSAKRQETLELNGEIYDQSLQDEQDYLAQLVAMNEAAGDNRFQKQIEMTQRTIAQKQAENAKYSKEAQKGLDEVNIIWRNGLDQMVSQITGASWRFEQGADGNVQAYVNGVKTGEPKSQAEMAKLVDKAIKEILNKQGASTQAGVNLINGVNNGIMNRNSQNSVFRSIANFGSTLLSRLQASLQERSPSRATNLMGRYLLQGLGIGIEKEEDTVLEQVNEFGKAVLGTLSTSLEDGISSNALQALKTAVPSEFSTSMAVDTTRMAEAAQNADKSLVGQFKEALMGVKIEMDEQEFGKFVDNTVTELVYN